MTEYICPLWDDCPMADELGDCPHQEPHEDDSTGDYCHKGYDAVPEDDINDFCCPACILVMGDFEDFIDKKEMEI